MSENSLINNSLRAYEPREIWPQKIRRRGYQRLLLLQTHFNLYYFWEKRWFFIAMVIGGILLSSPQIDGLTREGQIVLTMSIVVIILFVTEPIPLPTVALLIIVGQVLILGLELSLIHI